ncbi:cell division protein FtsQ/DivIB [Bergeyella cardium]|uniref:cell division protein FtsQ/DivIB n=1 Tax=Bergeyella cardium TaxID=1585976 RepID=UPI00162996FB|nr:cell division protein FtsQ [Bergeyella cardium]WHE34285.1 cell division protein FtsQ [Bergeyella cardium]WHF60936.1 cell division protein FtsQ [Bergeyella cardium]
MKNKYRILKILVTVIILGFLMNFSIKRFNNQKITDDKVSIHLNNTSTPVHFIDEADIKTLVNKENPSSRVGDVNIPVLEKKIKALPAVDSANVYLNLNGELNLDIKQRIPVFRLSKGEREVFYVDEKGVEFPISKNYSHKCMLVSGDVKPEEYPQLMYLVKKIENDDFCKKYFIGISKRRNNYFLLTSDGHYRVEIGDLDNIDFKIQGFKTFVEKILVYQDPEKYRKISVKYSNQIVTTLNPHFKENDSILAAGRKEMKHASEPEMKSNPSQSERKPKVINREEDKKKENQSGKNKKG